MDDNVQYLLQNVLNKQGIDIIQKPFQLDKLLREQAKGQFSVEIYLLVLSAAAGLVDKLLGQQGLSKTLASQLGLQLHKAYGVDESSAIWAIDRWIIALNLDVTMSVSQLTLPEITKTHGYFSERNRESDIFFKVEQTTKPLAVLFADICGSTSLYESIGDDLARHFTALCIKIMIKAIKPYQGTLIKTIGDEIMCTFPSADLALNAACNMQKAVTNGMANFKQHLSIRVGFHYGSVICEANDVFGDTVNVAARVAGFAKTEQIMTTDTVYAVLSADLKEKVKPFKSTSLKGKQDQCEIYWVSWKERDEMQTPMLPIAQHYITSPYMQVILKYIPQNTTHRQILQFVKPVLEGGLFSKSGSIERISVLVHKHQSSGAIDFHVILAIQPDEVAKRVIDKLHRKQLNGHYIAVMEYIERSIYNNKGIIYAKDKQPNDNCVVDRRDSTKRFRIISIEQLKDFSWTDGMGP